MSSDRPQNEAILRAEGLGRSVPGKVLVADVTFELARGEILAIVGPSGSGKSSLLRLLNRLDEPTDGTVYLDGVDYRKIAPRELRRRVGMVMQRPYFFRDRLRTICGSGPGSAGWNSPTADGVVAAVVLLDGLGGRDVANLSGGEQQRVSFARTLANSPEVMLLDEPTSALDETAKREVEAVIGRIGREQGIPCVLVTHDTAQAVRLAHRALVLESGRVVRSGAVNEVLRA